MPGKGDLPPSFRPFQAFGGRGIHVGRVSQAAFVKAPWIPAFAGMTMTDMPQLFYDLRKTAALNADHVESLPDTSGDPTLRCVGEATFSPSFLRKQESTQPIPMSSKKF